MPVPSRRRYRLLAEVSGHELEGAIILGLLGGLRVAEAVAVRWGDVDLSTGALLVHGSYWGPTKTGRPRALTLPASARSALRRYKKVQAERRLAVGVRQGDETYIVVDGLGEQMRPQRLSSTFRSFAAEHGFGALRFHAMRHTAAMLMLSSGTDVKTVAGRLGNSPKLVLDVYSHFVASADQAAARRLDELLG